MVCLVLRFPEALKYLEEGLALVNKLGDEKLAAYRWPGSQVIIEDTKPGKLLVTIIIIIILSLQDWFISIIFDIIPACSVVCIGVIFWHMTCHETWPTA